MAHVLFTTDPEIALETVGPFLHRDPVANNVVLTLLGTRVAAPEPGRYWIVDPEDPKGIVFQSPTEYPVIVTPMDDAAVDAAVEEILRSGAMLPGVNGDAATAARFAGRWTEATRSAAVPTKATRMYELTGVVPAVGTTGRLRQAVSTDTPLLVERMRSFFNDVGEPGQDRDIVEQRISAGALWVWEDAEPRSVAGLSDAVGGVVRIQAVYTPPALRGRGYASASVAELSRIALGRGLRPILYTDLANATSNSIYRATGRSRKVSATPSV